jgi:hypothetical protein
MDKEEEYYKNLQKPKSNDCNVHTKNCRCLKIDSNELLKNFYNEIKRQRSELLDTVKNKNINECMIDMKCNLNTNTHDVIIIYNNGLHRERAQLRHKDIYDNLYKYLNERDREHFK